MPSLTADKYLGFNTRIPNILRVLDFSPFGAVFQRFLTASYVTEQITNTHIITVVVCSITFRACTKYIYNIAIGLRSAIKFGSLNGIRARLPSVAADEGVGIDAGASLPTECIQRIINVFCPCLRL